MHAGDAMDSLKWISVSRSMGLEEIKLAKIMQMIQNNWFVDNVRPLGYGRWEVPESLKNKSR